MFLSLVVAWGAHKKKSVELPQESVIVYSALDVTRRGKACQYCAVPAKAFPETSWPREPFRMYRVRLLATLAVVKKNRLTPVGTQPSLRYTVIWCI